MIATFEDALRSATGEILFLADDDDVWAPTKVQRFMRGIREQAGCRDCIEPRADDR